MPESREEFASRLIEEWTAPIYNYAYRWLQDQGEAEDATQDIFIEALRSYARLRSASSLKPWIYKLASRVLLKHKRRREKRKAVAVSEDFELAAPPAADTLAIEERHALIGRTVASLPKKIRAAVMLKYYQGLTQHEVADALGLPRSTVQGRLKRGLELLKDRLSVSGALMFAPEIEALMASAPSLAAPSTLASSLSLNSAQALASTPALIGGGIVSMKVKAGLLLTILALLGLLGASALLDEGEPALSHEERDREPDSQAWRELALVGEQAEPPKTAAESAGPAERGRLALAEQRAPARPGQSLAKQGGGAPVPAPLAGAPGRVKAAAAEAGAAERKADRAGIAARDATKAPVRFTVAITARTEDGLPYEGALSLNFLKDDDHRECHSFKLRTDAGGRARLSPALMRGRYRAALTVSAFEPVITRALTPGGSHRIEAGAQLEFEALLMLDTGLKVQVIDDLTEAPIPGVQVSVSSPWATTDARGFVTVPGEVGAAVTVTSEKVGYQGLRIGEKVKTSGYSLAITLSAELRERGLTVRLRRGLSFSGQVFDERGAPIAATVQLVDERYDDAYKSRDLRVEDFIESEDGAFEFRGLGAGRYRVLARTERHAIAEALVDLSFQGRPPQLRLELRPGGVLTGRVEASGPIPRRLGPQVLALPSIDPHPEFGLRRSALYARKSRVGRDGTYRLEGLNPGMVDVQAQALGHEARVERAVVIREGGEQELDFELEVGGSIAGRVVGFDGEPVGAGLLILSPAGQNTRTPGQLSAGRFEFQGLSPGGRYDLKVFTSAWAETSVKGVAVGTTDLTITLQARVRVLGLLRTPPSGPKVTKLRYKAIQRSGEPVSGSSPVDERGRFVFWSNEALSSITLEAEGYQEKTLRGQAGDLPALVYNPAKPPARDLKISLELEPAPQ